MLTAKPRKGWRHTALIAKMSTTQINNAELKQNFIRAIKGNVLNDNTNPIASKVVVPIIDVTPTPNVISNEIFSTTAAGTIVTLKSDQDFYLTSAYINMGIDGGHLANDYAYLTVVCNGKTQNLLIMPQISSMTYVQTVTLPYIGAPIKLDRGSSIILSQDTNSGTHPAVSITGFYASKF